MSSGLRTTIQSLVGLAVFAALMFVPAGTLNYWQAWVFLAVITITTLGPYLHLSRIDPAAVERRRNAGPQAETRPVQKFAVAGIIVAFAALLPVAALDHRFGWSSVPALVAVFGNVLVAVGMGMAMLVIYQNRYASANITVESGQPLVTTGLYSFVRHPMYFSSVIMALGMPLALGSYWGLLFVIPTLILLAIRITDEERMLVDELAGYAAYRQQVRYRFLPYVW